MPFEYSCFISFRHVPGDLGERMVRDLAEALNNELGPLTGKEAYVDEQRLKGGDLYSEGLALALCRSACLVMVFTPMYFDLNHLYCAREYKAMEALEKKRLESLTGAQTHGLIIPVVFRGLDRMPAEIRGKRHYYDFQAFSLTDRRMAKHPAYAPKIRSIAEYIAARESELSSIANDICAECDQFRLPAETEIQPWVLGVRSSNAPFPFAQ